MTHPLISVVMPTWNAESTIQAAVESILGQTDDNFELIVVDDGSTDNAPEYLKSVRDSRFKVISVDHGGVVHAANTGIEAAQGDFIARMDSDDLAYPNRLAKQRQLMLERPEIGFCGAVVDYGGSREDQAGYARYVDWVNEQIEPEQISLRRFIESPFSNPSIFYRREVSEAHGNFLDGAFPEDYELVLRYLDAGVRMAKVPEPLMRWNDPPGRLSRTDDRYSFDAFYKCKAEYLARWLKINNPLYPDVVIWGAGRNTRKRARFLKDHGISIVGYVDLDPKKTGSPLNGIPRWHSDDMPGPGEIFVLTYVGSHGAREMNYDILTSKGFVEGVHFVQCA